MLLGWRPTSLVFALVSSVLTRTKYARSCVCARACHLSSRTIPYPRGYSRWQHLIIPRKVHPPIIGCRRHRHYHLDIVTDSSLLRYYYGRLAPFLDWHVTHTFILFDNAVVLARWKATRIILLHKRSAFAAPGSGRCVLIALARRISDSL